MAKSSNRSVRNVDWDKGYINYQRNVERRIVLIGKTGTGKSSFGNEVLGMKHFDNKGATMMSNTTVCKMGRCKTKGKDILVLDTPGLRDTKRPKEKTLEELMKCTMITAPGPHVFCLLIRCDDPFTAECIATLDEYCSFFGEEMYKHLIVVFTHKNELEKDQTIDGCLRSLPEIFQERFSRYRGKAIGVELKHINKRKRNKQIKDFFKLMEQIINRNDGAYYSDKMFYAVEKAFKKGEKKAQEKANKELEAVKKFLTSEHKKREQELLEREKKLKEELEKETKKREKDAKDHDKEAKELLEREKNIKEERDKLEHAIKVGERDKKTKIKFLQDKLEKEKKKREKDAEDHNKEVEDMKEKASQEIIKKLIEDRNEARKEILDSTGLFDIAKDVVTKGLDGNVIVQYLIDFYNWLFGGGGKGPSLCPAFH